MSYIQIKNISKSFVSKQGEEDSKLPVLQDFSLEIEIGEFVTIFGPNACGKSTLLNIVSGLLPADSGKLRVAGKPPGQALAGYVFQSFQDALLPWRTALSNVVFPLELRGIERKVREEQGKELLRTLRMEIPYDSYPYQLSGGQQQLISLARALISKPDLLVMDEPFNHLDYQTRIDMNDRVLDIWRTTGVTVLFVSHEIDETVLLGSKIVLLSKRPASILSVIDSPLARERTHRIVETKEFFNLKRRTLGVFERAIST